MKEPKASDWVFPLLDAKVWMTSQPCEMIFLVLKKSKVMDSHTGCCMLVTITYRWTSLPSQYFPSMD